MASPRHLSRAPITEALFDIRVKARPGFDVQAFAALKEELASTFPKVEDRKLAQFTIQFPPRGEKAPAIEDLGLQGFFFKSHEDDRIAQFRIDGFTFNKLRPYTRWDDLLPQAMALWAKYRTTANPEAVIRLALRYINHINIPQERVDFDDYFVAAPHIPADLPQSLSAFLYRVTIVSHESHLACHVVQALDTTATAPGITTILDIDTYRDVDIAADDPSIEAQLNELHDFKNMVFFSYLTDRALALFE